MTLKASNRTHCYNTLILCTIACNLTPTQESNDCNFLDLTIIRRISHLDIDIYWKPTKIDTQNIFYATTVTNTKWQHTDIALRECSISRLMQNAHNPPHRTAQRFSTHNNTKIKTPDKAKDKTHRTTHKHEEKLKKWATFTFISPHIRKITNQFRNTNVRIAFRCWNTIGKLTKPPKDYDIPRHNKWGIYQHAIRVTYRMQAKRAATRKYVFRNTSDTSGATTPNRLLPNIFCKMNTNTAIWTL